MSKRYTAFARFHVDQAFPEVIALSLVRELGPVLSGSMMAERLGAFIVLDFFLQGPRCEETAGIARKDPL